MAMMYRVYANADPITNRVPTRLSVAPSGALYNNPTPARARAMQHQVCREIFSLKKMAIMRATITGYTNRIVEAMPESIYW